MVDSSQRISLPVAVTSPGTARESNTDVDGVGCIFSVRLCSVDSDAAFAAHEVSRTLAPFGSGPSVTSCCLFCSQPLWFGRGAGLVQGPSSQSVLPESE